MTTIKHMWIIELYPNSKPPELWINASNFVFKTEETARKYANALNEIEFFWAYTIKPLLVFEDR